MVNKMTYQRIQELRKKGFGRNEISLKLGIDIKTVRKYYNMSQKKYQKYLKKNGVRFKVFDNYFDEVLEVYKKNNFTKLNMAGVYDYLEEKYGKLPGGEKTFRNYINHLIQSNQLVFDKKTRIYQQVPELPFGYQMQLDFGEYRLSNGKKLYIFAAVLSASRYKFVVFQDKPFKAIDVILHLLDCFDYFGGIPQEIVIDQDKLMVIRENYGDIIYTKDFDYFRNEMGLRMYVCRKADPESKGKIENLVKYVKLNFLSIRDFGSTGQANESVAKWLKRRANGKISQATKRIPAEIIEEERPHLKRLKNSIFRKDFFLGREERTVNDNYISVSACYYGVPGQYNNKKVEIYQTDSQVFIFDCNTGSEITNYHLSPTSGKKIMHREFKREKGTSIEDLKKEVLSMFDMPVWEQFLVKNFKEFARYTRDQCIDAKKRLGGKNIDPVILEEALNYCLRNETYSVLNLNDTYQYYFKMHKEAVKDLGGYENVEKIRCEYFNLPDVDVKKRSLKEYHEIAAGGRK